MKKIQTTNFYKKAQTQGSGYTYEHFADEIFEANGPIFKIINIEEDSDFDQSYVDQWDARTETHLTPSVDAGTEHIEVSVSAIGSIDCPVSWISNQLIKDLEHKLNEDLKSASEIYLESGDGLWGSIGEYLSDFDQLYRPDIDSSYCYITIKSLNPISKDKIQVTLGVEAEIYAEGDMIDREDYDEEY